ncbi:uncharacterized protein KD926_007884 [Aspergillus affinis]|uniref:uncharacterized protein n=1 Tax=Aspergillus affinis TaxID=1070780 RepID=UPI0022FE4607|nr:uncharacterized protein KD926_007884 [Aspergillus affinis]KAI9040668.1 hypothetical protein KD926_007884 [Aspergillus affinis]
MCFCKKDILEDYRTETREAIRDIKESQEETRIIIALGEPKAGKATLIDDIFDPFRKYSKQPEAIEPSPSGPFGTQYKPWGYGSFGYKPRELKPTAGANPTSNCEIVQASIKSQRYAFIDTPGIDKYNAKRAFKKLVDLIRHIRDDNVVFEGIWYVVNSV